MFYGKLTVKQRQLVDQLEESKRELISLRWSLSVLGERSRDAVTKDLVSKKAALMEKIKQLEIQLMEMSQ